MGALAAIRRMVAAATLAIFGICVVTCLGMQPEAKKLHDCCPRSDSGKNCPEGVKATACSLNSLDFPKSKFLPDALPVAVLPEAGSLLAADMADPAMVISPYTGDLLIRNCILRI